MPAATTTAEATAAASLHLSKLSSGKGLNNLPWLFIYIVMAA